MANGQLGGVLRYIRQLVSTGTPGDASDGQLLHAFASQQDAAAFEALVRRYAPLVWGVCRRVLRDEHEAEDAFQGTFLVLVRKAATLDRGGSLANWLYTVAYHLALRARTQSARRHVTEVADMAGPDADPAPWELNEVLDEELHRLPDRYRAPLVLCYLQGKTNEEAALELGCPAGSMSRHLTRGKELLKERLTGRGVALTAAALTTGLAETAGAAPPAAVVSATVQASLLFASGKAVGAVSPTAVALAEGFLKVAAVSKARIAVALVLALTLVGTGSVLAYRNLHETPTNHEEQRRPVAAFLPPAATDGGLADTVDRQIDAWQPTRQERRIDEIGWAADLRQARALAKEHQRPIFLLVHSGDVATNRSCSGSAHTRASAMSNDQVIDLLNRYFVPVYIANDDYRSKEGKASAEEKAELRRILAEANKEGILGGTSWAYVLSPEGKPVGSMHGCTAATVTNLSDLLRWNIDPLAVQPGEPLVAPRKLSQPPAVPADALILHLTARYLKKQGAEIVLPQPVLGTDRTSGWHTMPGENWLVLSREQTLKLLPAQPPTVGTTWNLDARALESLFRCFYPPTEANDLRENDIEDARLTATVVAIHGNTARARLEGKLRVKHPQVHQRDDGLYVEADLRGYLDFDLAHPRVRALRLYTPTATYGANPIGVAVRSVP